MPIGVLRPLTPKEVATGANAVDIVISPDGLNAYVCNTSAETISQYSRNPETGLLTALGTVACASPENVAISPDGKNAYATNLNNATITQYSRNSKGELTSLGTKGTGINPGGVRVSPDGKNVYSTDSVELIRIWSRNSETGVLTELETVFSGNSVQLIAISGDGKFLYATNELAETISQYSRNPETGLLTALSPAHVAAGNHVRGIALTPGGENLYAGNVEAETISQYSRNPETGLLTALGTVACANPYTLVATNSYVYAVDNISETIAATQYSRNPETGLLTALSPAHVTGPGQDVISLSGSNVYTAGGGVILQFRITQKVPIALHPPTIGGPALQGFTEEALEGTWESALPILTRNVQWFREGAPIEGAIHRAYVPTVADIERTITVVETVTDSEGNEASSESLPVKIKPGIPTVLTPPFITGPAVVGEVEFEGHGRWKPEPESFTYQWFRCDSGGGSPKAIEGATGKSYVPVAADVSHTLRVSEVAVDKAGSSEPATSAPSPVVTATAATRTGLPPTQPAVPEPVLQWPFRMAEDESHIPFIEQDTAQEYEQCVALTLTTQPGEFPDEPEFGLPDPAFSEGGIGEADLLAAIRKWEPRAHTFFTLDELVDTTQELGIQVRS